MRQSARGFLIAFFCALSIVGLLCGFALADSNTRLTGFRDNAPLFRVQSAAPLRYDVLFLGEEWALSFDWLNTAAKYGQRLFCFAPPPVRLLLRVFTGTGTAAAHTAHWPPPHIQ